MDHDGAARLVSEQERAVLSAVFYEAYAFFPEDDDVKEATWEAWQALEKGPGGEAGPS